MPELGDTGISCGSGRGIRVTAEVKLYHSRRDTEGDPLPRLGVGGLSGPVLPPAHGEALRAKAQSRLEGLTRSSHPSGALRVTPHFTAVRPRFRLGFVKVVDSTSSFGLNFKPIYLHQVTTLEEPRLPRPVAEDQSRTPPPSRLHVLPCFPQLPCIPSEATCFSDCVVKLSSQATYPCIFLLESRGRGLRKGCFESTLQPSIAEKPCCHGALTVPSA